MERVRFIAAVLVTIGMPVLVAAEDAAVPALFTEASEAGLRSDAQAFLARKRGSPVLYGRSVRVNPAVFKSPRVGDRMRVNLFAGLTLEAVCTETGKTGTRVLTWIGSVVGETPSRVALFLENGLVIGSVRVAGIVYEIEPIDRPDSSGLGGHAGRHRGTRA